MTIKEAKLTSKVIQISTIAPVHPSRYCPDRVIVALCEDGSVWERKEGNEKWDCILEINKKIKND